MAPRSAKITLDGTDYDVPALDIDQLERVTDLLAGSANRVPFGVLRIALERATPKPNDVNRLTPASIDEVRDAVRAIMVMSGLATNASSAAPALGLVPAPDAA